ncbi:MAG TPA: hypothetical protein PLQ93_08975 [Bacteroidia bacterium]|nr:hypothetical protein [Bacteroidia bacterium]
MKPNIDSLHKRQRLYFWILFILFLQVMNAQTRNIRVNTRYMISDSLIEGRLNSQAENLDHCSIQILDSAQNEVLRDRYPRAVQKPGIKQWTELKTPIWSLAPGSYTMVVYLGKEEMEKVRFTKSLKNLKQVN